MQPKELRNKIWSNCISPTGAGIERTTPRAHWSARVVENSQHPAVASNCVLLRHTLHTNKINGILKYHSKFMQAFSTFTGNWHLYFLKAINITLVKSSLLGCFDCITLLLSTELVFPTEATVLGSPIFPYVNRKLQI